MGNPYFILKFREDNKMSQVFNIGVLTNKNSDVTNVLSSSFIEESYFVTTLEYVTEAKKELRENIKDLYMNITEAKSDQVINESFNEFVLNIKEAIKKFIEYIKSLFDRFITMFHRMIKSDSYIIKNKDIFRKFDNSHEFEFEGYEYTFDPNIPVINALAEFNTEFIELNFDIMNGKKDNGEYLKYIKSIHGKLQSSLKDGYYDKFRAEVLGLENYEIGQSEFAEELFEIYRNGYSKKDTITINKDNIMFGVLSFFENYKELEKSVTKKKNEIEKEYKRIEKSLEKLVNKNSDYDISKAIEIGIHSDYDGSSIDTMKVSQEVLNNLNLFIKTKTNQVMEMSSIHAMAFSYKLDAIKECYEQDRKILYKALSNIQKKKLINRD